MSQTESHKSSRFFRALILFAALLGFGGVTEVHAEPMTATVYYFHSTLRCAECLEVERLAEEVLQQTFSSQLSEGHLAWHAVNVDLPENTSFVFTFDLSANELVVACQQDGIVVSWDKLTDVWRMADDHEQLRVSLVDLIRQALSRSN